MPQESEVCEKIDFSPLVPDNPKPPTCEMGHGWSRDCMKVNGCPDYKKSVLVSLEEVKAKYNIEEATNV